VLANERAGKDERIVLPDEADSVLGPAIAHKGYVARDVYTCRTSGTTRNRSGKTTDAPAFFNVANVIVPELLQAL